MFRKHYYPGIPVILNKKPKNKNHAYIIFGKGYEDNKNYFNLSKKADLKEAASNLYKIMKKIKKKDIKKYLCLKFQKRVRV